jgi:hypothetical protein
MKLLDCTKVRIVLVGFVAAIVLGGGSTNAEIIMSEPTNLGPVINDAYDVQNSDFSQDGLQLYFAVWSRPDGFGSGDIYMAERETLNSPWKEPVNLGPNVNSSACEVEPSISSDGLELYFASWDDWYIRVCKRLSKDDPWSSPVKVGPPIGSGAYGPDISADGLSLYFASSLGGGYGGDDIWMVTRATTNDDWGEPVNLGPNVNNSADQFGASISNDSLMLVFSQGLQSIWATSRKSIDDDWGPAMRLEISGTGDFFSPTLSPDGSTLYFQAVNAWGGYGKNDFWQVKFIPIVDFNGDGIVDADDMCIMVDHWGENYSLCDIGPSPLGDGIVDVQDLIVLAEHLFEEVFSIELIGYWKLDETEGDITYNSTSDNHGLISGNPTWQPDSGQVAGAIKFDGVDDYISTDFVLNPADGYFSVFAWIKGGDPGQVILSQTGGANWLSVDPLEGKLMTELVPPTTRSPSPPMVSDFVITDGKWHHVGIVVTAYGIRNLYADGIRVAFDIQTNNLPSSNGGLYFGTGNNLDSGTFFSGMIDDVRIYNKALSPIEIAALVH